MRVFITGGTGMIGRRLVRRLVDRGDVPVILSRKPTRPGGTRAFRASRSSRATPRRRAPGRTRWTGATRSSTWPARTSSASDGTPRSSGRSATAGSTGPSTSSRRSPRPGSRPKVLVQGSAIGYYGTHGDEELTESSPSGSDFLAVVCRELEEAARQVEPLGRPPGDDPDRGRPGQGRRRPRRDGADLQAGRGHAGRQRRPPVPARPRAGSG